MSPFELIGGYGTYIVEMFMTAKLSKEGWAAAMEDGTFFDVVGRSCISC